ncbi:hypothetical protein SFRURICE_018061 [Spodoptera frugiperda]|uniref:SFRICE_008629 n=1 Tax=Spodoptera frugiperda TaxID=7108 RepID=A0A2H1VGA7_SPOFR|nr:hypothetical protein SFRURICE_018061 [Spodoptera frugiperda]
MKIPTLRNFRIESNSKQKIIPKTISFRVSVSHARRRLRSEGAHERRHATHATNQHSQSLKYPKYEQ